MEHEESLEHSSRRSNTNHALPFELLGAVFLHISEDPLDLRYAIFVCRSWYNAIVHHANLWTNIILRHTFLTRFRGARLPHGDAFVRSCLSRSWPLPLHISLHGPDCYSLYTSATMSSLSNECFSVFAHIVGKSTESGTLFQRCRSLTWFCCSGFDEANIVAQAFTSASAPALEYLTIMDMYPEEVHLFRFPRLPRLKEVTLIECSYGFIQYFFHDDDLANVEKLTFIADVWADHGINFIRRFRNIRALMLKGPNTLHWYMDPLSGPVNPVELPLLETLSIFGVIAHQVLYLVRAPGLRKMEIKAVMGGGHSLTATNLVHLVRTLECLYLSLKEGEHAASWVEELERLVAEAPVLVSVCVSPWMTQYRTGKEWRTGLHYITDSNRNLRSSPTQY